MHRRNVPDPVPHGLVAAAAARAAVNSDEIAITCPATRAQSPPTRPRTARPLRPIGLPAHTSSVHYWHRLACDADRHAPTLPPGLNRPARSHGLCPNLLWRPTTALAAAAKARRAAHRAPAIL